MAWLQRLFWWDSFESLTNACSSLRRDVWKMLNPYITYCPALSCASCCHWEYWALQRSAGPWLVATSADLTANNIKDAFSDSGGKSWWNDSSSMLQRQCGFWLERVCFWLSPSRSICFPICQAKRLSKHTVHWAHMLNRWRKASEEIVCESNKWNGLQSRSALLTEHRLVTVCFIWCVGQCFI